MKKPQPKPGLSASYSSTRHPSAARRSWPACAYLASQSATFRTGWDNLAFRPTPASPDATGRAAGANVAAGPIPVVGPPMSNLIPGFVAALLLIMFLGFYAVRLNSLALWVIICSVLAMVIVDYVQSVRSDGNKKSR